MSEISKQAEQSMKQVLEHLDQELRNIRSGRANPGLLDGVQVEVYGTQMKLRDLANVTTPEARQILITPYDHSNAGVIKSGVEKANLGMQPILDGHIIRINIPPMDEAQRKENAKLVHRRGEEAKVSIRNARREGRVTAGKLKDEGELSEDLFKKEEKIIQDLTDKYCKLADERCATKEKEITSI